jgi:AcrR family transcriptional regulator
MRRAYRPEEKELRRRGILDEARRLLASTPYPALRMNDLAQRLGLAKGTLYLYFPAKESLFLALLEEEMGGWFQEAAGLLEQVTHGRAERLAGDLVDALLARPLLPVLQALLHGVLEQNLPLAEACDFARFLQAGVILVGDRLQRALPALGPGQGRRYLIRFHALVIGCQQMSARPAAVRAALGEPGMELFDFDFPQVFRAAATDLLLGMVR